MSHTLLYIGVREFQPLLLEEVRNELTQAATPGQELMASTGGLAGLDLDAQLTQAVDNGLALDKVI